MARIALKSFDRFRVRPGKKIKLLKVDTEGEQFVPEREEAEALTEKAVARIGELQDKLYAEGSRAVLVVLQGMDAAGKDGTVRKVFDAVNPTGVVVTSFKQPSALELKHDFLWRVHNKVPSRGILRVFNRSHYEDVLVARVHADRILPENLKGDKTLWSRRFQQIRGFERLLVDNGTTVVKFMLHISKEEQAERFRARQQEPEKQWKLAAGDFAERKFWDDYQAAFESMLPETASDFAPWYVIPADKKWVRNYLISQILAGIMERMDIRIPELADPSLVKLKFE